jgi:hypothetical protein
MWHKKSVRYAKVNWEEEEVMYRCKGERENNSTIQSYITMSSNDSAQRIWKLITYSYKVFHSLFIF